MTNTSRVWLERAEHSVSLWWEDIKTGRRMKQRPRKQYQHKYSASCMDAETVSDEEPEITAAKEVQCTSEEPTCIFQLDDWDKWFGPPPCTNFTCYCATVYFITHVISLYLQCLVMNN